MIGQMIDLIAGLAYYGYLVISCLNKSAAQIILR
ncbi:MAG: hypothetical protein CM15mP23_18860 [Cryomorphaceae bacterium]|nr:MAG: hypothetical protein CM15mP23_18860 [Cryomorphaceae bacterium]